ncbi:hypothetical protein [Piscibacillus halophilus]|uniref:hypothetical protein n=1 Tax=Piscibacillus halophilus TaxID=571933 RepID=UPI002409E81F|nr:hypothetical protein [Piscibacillus halophilus]
MIKIIRETSWTDRFREYKVILNETEIGFISAGETFEYPLNQGRHTLYLKVDWCRSEKIDFEVRDNEILEFQCGALNGFKSLIYFWYITFRRNRYLWIKQVES